MSGTAVETMFLGRFIHLVVVSLASRDRRVHASLSGSLSLKPSAREAKCCTFLPMVAFLSPAIPPRRKGARHAVRTSLGRARCSTLLDEELLCLTRVRVYTPQTEGGQPVDPRTWGPDDGLRLQSAFKNLYLTQRTWRSTDKSFTRRGPTYVGVISTPASCDKFV